ncbi:exported protein of unknown function [Burkholderia multivorans]
MRSRIYSVFLVWMVLFVGTVSAAFADELTRSVTTRHLTVHYGVVPARHAAELASGSSPEAAHNVNLYVLTVALFDRSTGESIENAHVMAVVNGPRSEASRLHAKPMTRRLDPARAGGSVTYGNLFDMRWRGMSLPPKNESLAERLNSSKENQEDEQDEAGALHARIQAGSRSAGQGRPERCGGGRDAGRAGAIDFQLGQG